MNYKHGCSLNLVYSLQITGLLTITLAGLSTVIQGIQILRLLEEP